MVLHALNLSDLNAGLETGILILFSDISFNDDVLPEHGGLPHALPLTVQLESRKFFHVGWVEGVMLIQCYTLLLFLLDPSFMFKS